MTPPRKAEGKKWKAWAIFHRNRLLIETISTGHIECWRKARCLPDWKKYLSAGVERRRVTITEDTP